MAASRKIIICKCGAVNRYYYEPYKACLKCKEPFKVAKKRKKRVETKKRKCGQCGKTGHNKATCKSK
jgi:hypothetical protein